MSRLAARAPAKINLGLRIVARRADGFHEIDSVFAPLDLCDELELAVAPAEAACVSLELELDPDVDGVPAGPENLALRAASAFLTASGRAARVRVRLRKRIPAAAGLGGGSSDAGAVLRLLARHFPDALPPDALAALALRLGADVPFFLDPRPARVSGVGERIAPLADLPAVALLLVRPRQALATREVYRALDALQTGKTSPPRASLQLWEDADARRAAMAELLENDLAPAAVRLCPPVGRLRERLRALGALGVGMSGSGPTVFGVFADARAAEAALDALPREPSIWARAARTVHSD